MALALAAGWLCAGTALAEKPSWAGKKGGDASQAGKGGDASRGHNEVHAGSFFGERHRTAVHDYYGQQHSSGRRCPPGLAKKHNGCMPPGQAKKWHQGQPLARDVVYYDLPHSLSQQLGRPPSGHRLVRVASDILLITIGTGMVVDALQDLGRI